MWTQHFIDTKRGTFELFVKGSGQPICITHLYSAFNSNGNTFANSFTNEFTVYLVNLRGAGNSVGSVQQDDLSMKESIKDLDSIREALQFDKWSFAGHSTGGMLGLAYAIQIPQSIEKMVIGGAAASKEYMNHPGSIYCKENPHNERLLEIFALINNSKTPPDIRKAVGREWTEMSLYRPEMYEEYFNTPNSGSVVSARLDYYSYTELPSYNLTPYLAIIQIPTIVYCGEHDAQCPHVFSEQIAEDIPNAKLITFTKSNHFPFTEEPEKFTYMVKSLINSSFF